MLRSIYCISRFLPGYSFFGKKGYSYSLHYRLFSNLKSQKNFEKKKTSTIKISNASLMNLGINIEYLTKDSMCVLEITLLNGSSIKFESCFGKDRLRGKKTDYLIADEIEKGRNKASYLDIILSDIKYEQAYCID